MYTDYFTKIGFTKTQSEVLNILLTKGEDKASNIARKARRPRGVVYKALEELEELDLVAKQERLGGVNLFSVKSPHNIEKVFNQKEQDLLAKKHTFFKVLPDLVSSYNLFSGKPYVKFLEGDEGIMDLLDDTLKSNSTIYTFLDHDNLKSNFTRFYKDYLEKIPKLEVDHKIISFLQAKDDLAGIKNDLIKTRYLNDETSPFSTTMHVYDNKVSFQVISNNHKIAILIQDTHMYNMHKFFFENIWKNLK